MRTYEDRKREYVERALSDRPEGDVIDLFRRTPPAYISDYLKKLGLTGFTMVGVKPLKLFKEYKRHIAGPAITMKFAPATKAYEYTEAPYMHTEIVEMAEKGDVIVIDGLSAPHGFWGENANRTAIRRGAEAVVVDGYTRDSTPIMELGLPVFSTGVTFDSYVLRYDVVGYNVPINCAGAQVRPGDIIVGDNDGVVVIPREKIDEVAEGAKLILELEDQMHEWVESGRPWKDIYPEVHARKYLAGK